MHQLNRDVGLLGLTFIAVSGTIGTGWLFAPLFASQDAGPAAIVAWLFGAVAMAILAMTFAEISSLLPVAGGVARIPYFTHGKTVSMAMGWTAWIGYCTAAPVEVEAILSYVEPQMPWLFAAEDVLSPYGMAFSIAALALFSVLNAFGVRFLARLNTTLTWFKLALPVVVIAVIASSRFEASNLTELPGGFAPTGFQGIFAAVSTGGVILSYIGFRHAIDMAGEARNPHITVPLALGLSVLICLIVYGATQIAFIGALSPDNLGAGWAGLAFPHHMGPLAALLVAGGALWMVAPLVAGSGVSAFGASLVAVGSNARIALAMARNGIFPAFMRRVSALGVPIEALAVNFAVSSLVFIVLPFKQVVALNTSAILLSFVVGPIGAVTLRTQMPHQERTFAIPVVMLSSGIAFVLATFIVYWGGWDTARHLAIAMVAGLILFGLVLRKHGPAELDLREAAWLAPYLVGLVLLCWLGSSEGAVGLLPFGWDLVAVGVFAVAIFAAAVRSHLPHDRFQVYLAEAAGLGDDR